MSVPFFNLNRLNARYRDAYIGALSSVLNGHSLILDGEVERFERSWAKYCQRDHCIGVGNGYDALRLMLQAFDIGPRHRVLVAANTHVATWLAVMSVGATPVPVDVEEHTFQMDPAKIPAAMTRDTRAILVTHLYGRVGDMRALRKVAANYGPDHVALLVDAAQAHGIKGASLGDAAAFSFYPTKNLGALGDAGAVVLNDGVRARCVRSLRNYGKTETNPCYYFAGSNSRLDELQAAFLNVKLPLLDESNARRRSIAMEYDAGTWGCYDDAPEECVWHQYVLRHAARDTFRERLSVAGVQTMIHYTTIPHLEPVFARYGYRAGDAPVAESLARRIVSLPMNPGLSDNEIAAVVSAVKRAA